MAFYYVITICILFIDSQLNLTVWYVIRGMDVTVNTDEAFMKSSFAQHVAGHCKNFQSTDEVVRWCVKNIKVEKISKKFSAADTTSPADKGSNFEF